MDDEIMTSNTVTNDKIVNNETKSAKSTVNNLHYSSETEDENDSDYPESRILGNL